MSEPIKSVNAALLNRLHEMQCAPYYVVARSTLADAEATIFNLEAEVALKQRHAEAWMGGLEAVCTIIGAPICVGSPHELTEAVRGMSIARAFEIADGAMFELLVSEAIGPREGDRMRFPASARDEVEYAVAWLAPRGYVSLEGGDREGGAVVRVLREPDGDGVGDKT